LLVNGRPDLPRGYTRRSGSLCINEWYVCLKATQHRKSRFTWRAREILTTCTLHQDVANCDQYTASF
jgi:hypothetical protein